MISDDQFQKKLHEAIFLLSKSPNEQCNIIQDEFLGSFDELGLIFDDAIITLSTKFAEHVVTEQEYSDIKEIDTLLSAISGQENAAFWTAQGIQNKQVWKDIRIKALAILKNHSWLK